MKTDFNRRFPSCLFPSIKKKSLCTPLIWTLILFCKSNQFLYKRFYTKARFEREGKNNFGVAYFVRLQMRIYNKSNPISFSYLLYFTYSVLFFAKVVSFIFMQNVITPLTQNTITFDTKRNK